MLRFGHPSGRRLAAGPPACGRTCSSAACSTKAGSCSSSAPMDFLSHELITVAKAFRLSGAHHRLFVRSTTARTRSKPSARFLAATPSSLLEAPTERRREPSSSIMKILRKWRDTHSDAHKDKAQMSQPCSPKNSRRFPPKRPLTACSPKIPARPAFTCSFQAEDMIVLDLLRKRVPDIPVLFLDTGYHFAETYAYRDRMATSMEFECAESCRETIGRRAGIRIRHSESHRSRHVLPFAQSRAAFRRACRNYDVWFTGLAPRAIAHAQESENCGAPRAAERQSAAESEPARRLDMGPSLEIHRREQDRLSCRSTTRATAASAASRAPQSPRQAPIRAPAAGAARSSSAASTPIRSGPIDAHR